MMLYSAYFAERAEHYRKFATSTPNGRQAEFQLGLANMFLEMSCEMRLRELAAASDLPLLNRNATTSQLSGPSHTPRKTLKGMRRLFSRTAEREFNIHVEHLR
jgi:hypothetical protein